MCNNNENATKSVANLVISGLVPREAHRVSDFNKALVELRYYGAPQEDALDILDHEVTTLKDYEINHANSVSPDLIEIFGVQHVKDAISYAYCSIERFKLSFDEYKHILLTLLKVYRPEQLISNPELIRYFLTNLDLADRDNFESVQDLENSIIQSMAEKPIYQVTD